MSETMLQFGYLCFIASVPFTVVICGSLLLYLLQWLFVLHCFCTFYNGRMAASNGDVDAAFVPAATLMQVQRLLVSQHNLLWLTWMGDHLMVSLQLL